MKLRLAEYKDIDFVRFWNFPEFGYYGDFISLSNELLNTERAVQEIEAGFKATSFKKDKKDPLNRFDGLFDGRTYGNGRFVLMRQVGEFCEDSIIDDNLGVNPRIDIKLLEWGLEGGFINQNSWELLCLLDAKYLGNIHENPKLLSGQRINFDEVSKII